jgi:hypothetical protein
MSKGIISIQQIAPIVRGIRDQIVPLDFELARLADATTENLDKALRRNRDDTDDCALREDFSARRRKRHARRMCFPDSEK